MAAIAMVLLFALRFEMMRGLVQEAQTMPMWARLSAEGPGPISAYYRALQDDFPLVISLSPLIFLVVLLRNWRLGGLLLCWFAIPLGLHSVVFPWKSERYVLLALPALFLATGIAMAAGTEALYRFLARQMETWPSLRERRNALALLITVVIVGCAVLTTPAFNFSRRLPSTRESVGWQESVALLAKRPELASLPIGSAQPLVALHYWGRLDFTVQRALLESWSRDSTTGGFNNPYALKAMGSPDVYAGKPTLTTAEAIRQAYRDRGGVLIGIDQKYLTFNNIDPTLRAALEHEARDLCENHCGSMRLYHWTFGQEP
jgi:hypothetical protein